jgi:hypothetical protein
MIQQRDTKPERDRLNGVSRPGEANSMKSDGAGFREMNLYSLTSSDRSQPSGTVFGSGNGLTLAGDFSLVTGLTLIKVRSGVSGAGAFLASIRLWFLARAPLRFIQARNK